MKQLIPHAPGTPPKKLGSNPTRVHAPRSSRVDEPAAEGLGSRPSRNRSLLNSASISICRTASWLLRVAAGLVLGWAAVRPTSAGDAGTPPRGPLVRIGISPGTWSGVNTNDAQAAIMAWARTIIRERGISVNVETRMFETVEALGAAIRNGQVDALSMLTDQFLALNSELLPKTVFVSFRGDSTTEEYVLLARKEGPVSRPSDLKGRKLVIPVGSRTSLAPYWLETLLARDSLGPAAANLESITRNESPSRAVLQVFFRQADACLVSSNVFALACELNPRLRKELRVLASSPPVIPSVFFFRNGFQGSVRNELEPAILTLSQSAAGRQVLTVFQADGMVQLPSSCFDGSRRLLEDSRQPPPGPEVPLRRP